ncbi:MAG: anaerobic ribonucleoside-triphosphate reductase activating protein [Candidatus Brocadiia bacterium]
MLIKGFMKSSLLEWEGMLSSVLFLPRCNLRCRYCHAGDLVLHPDRLDTIPFAAVERHLRENAGWIDGVAITGGEPTLHGEELLELCGKLKDLSVQVMVETNGTRPEWVGRLLEGRLVDAMSMDVKAPLSPEAYARVAGREVDVDDLRRSIDLIGAADLTYYEFRTTLVPGLVGPAELESILSALEGSRRIALQNFRPTDCLDPELHSVEPFSPEQMDELGEQAAPYCEEVVVRGRDHALTERT